jgi:serine protease Do
VPAAQPGGDVEGEAAEGVVLGMTLSPVTDELRAQLELDSNATGLVVKDVDPLAEAHEKGMRAGDLITEAGQQKLMSVSDLETRIEDAQEAGRKSLLLLVRRAGEPRFVALSLETAE